MLIDLHALPKNRPQRHACVTGSSRLHLPLVVYLARRFTGRNEPITDLVQVGRSG